MPLTWTDDLAVGFGRIDEQHRELFSRYNNLFQACTHGKGREVITPMLDFLAEYAEEHFAEEERYMALHHYPDHAHHVQQHREFSGRVAAFRQAVEASGPSAEVMVTLLHALIHWLVSHVKQVDVKLGAFLQARGA